MLYELPLSKNYVSNWSFWEAVRELAQNAMDNEDVSGEKVFIGKDGEDFLIRTRNTTIGVDTLVLGNTTKDGTSQRGAFGEGYKLALIVLLRMGFTVQIHNGADIWNPSFIMSEKFHTEILAIDVQKDVLQNKDLTFIIKDVGEHTKILKDKIIIPGAGDIETSDGWILCKKEMKGKIYCGNLYVCDSPEELTSGYNFHPDSIELGRDRHLVSSFNIKWLSSKMWAEVGHSHSEDSEVLTTLSKMVANSVNDTRYIGNHYSGGSLASIVAEAFYEGYTDKHYPVDSISSLRSVILKYSDVIPVFVDSQVCELVKNSNKFNTNKTKLIPRVLETPYDQMTKLVEGIREQVSEEVVEGIKVLVDRSKYWLNDTDSIMDELIKTNNEEGSK